MLNITHLALYLLIGLIAGFLSGKFMTDKGFGKIGNLITAIIGALIGGHLLGLLGMTTYGLIGSLFMSILGSIIFLFLASLIKKT